MAVEVDAGLNTLILSSAVWLIGPYLLRPD